jgi:chitodextrinase
MVFIKDQRVYVAQTDGGNAHQVTGAWKWWAWPSESDDGAITVAGGASRVNPGGASESSGSSELYAFTQFGKSLLSKPVETPGSVSSPALPVYVNHFRVSPDGSEVAYDVLGCCGASDASTFVSPLVSGGTNWRDFQDDYIEPQWVDASKDPWVKASNALTLTHNGIPIWGNSEYAIYNAANQNDGEGSGWADDDAINDGWDFQTVFDPDLSELAVFLDDASNYTDATPRHVEVQFEKINWNDGSTSNDCRFSLSTNAFKSLSSLQDASPAISPDGSTFAWSQDDGIYEMNISDQSNCDAMAATTRRVVAGGSMPSFSTATLAIPHPTASITLPTHPRASHVLRFKGTGSHEAGGGIASYRWKFGDGDTASGAKPRHTYARRGHYKVTLVVTDLMGDTAKTIKRIKVAR